MKTSSLLCLELHKKPVPVLSQWVDVFIHALPKVPVKHPMTQEFGHSNVSVCVTSDGDDSKAARRADGSEVGRGAGRAAGGQVGRAANTGACKESGPKGLDVVRLLGVDLGLDKYFFALLRASGFGKGEHLSVPAHCSNFQCKEQRPSQLRVEGDFLKRDGQENSSDIGR